MGRKYVKYLEGNNLYACYKCKVHLAKLSDLLSKSFVAESGQAFLFNAVQDNLTRININQTQSQQKRLRTGLHKICGITCIGCDLKLGWKYIYAFNESEKYKQGRFILEQAFLKEELWDDQD